MKFCYIDESGKGDEPILVVAGILVDAQRMHVTKADWEGLLKSLSKRINRPVDEFHTRNFYKGNGIWRELKAHERVAAMDGILDWLDERKHLIVFSSIEKQKARKADWTGKKAMLNGASEPDYWKVATLHLMLSVQKTCQAIKKNKGHTVMVFDRGAAEDEVARLALSPPEWTDSFYGFKRKSRKANPDPPLQMVVDVPYFTDSKHVGLLQLADFFAYMLRHHAQLSAGAAEQYTGERARVAGWVERMVQHMTPDSDRWKARGGCTCSNFLRAIAPDSLLGLTG